MRSALIDDLLRGPSGSLRAESGPDAAVAREFARRIADHAWHSAFELACKHIYTYDLQARTRALMIDAARSAGAQEAGMAALAALVTAGEWAPLPHSLYLTACVAAGRAADLDLASPLSWEAGLLFALDDTDPDLVAPMIESIRPCIGPNSLVRMVIDIVEKLPERRPGDCFVDSPYAAVQLVRSASPAPGGLLVCLAGARGKIGMPFNMFHRWAAATSAHILYLRDTIHHDFRDGVAEIGPTFADLVAFVRDLAAALGVDRIATYGNSGGGIVSARLGLMAGASRIVVAAGVTSPRSGGGAPAQAAAAAARRAAAHEIEERRRDAGGRSEILWIFARDNVRDAADAEGMREVEGVRLMPLPVSRHNVAVHLIATRVMAPILEWVTGDRATPDPVAEGTA